MVTQSTSVQDHTSPTAECSGAGVQSFARGGGVGELAQLARLKKSCLLGDVDRVIPDPIQAASDQYVPVGQLALLRRAVELERGLEDLDVEAIDRIIVRLDLVGNSQLAGRDAPTAFSSWEPASAAIRASCRLVP